jgi:predicted Zn-dependent protease
MRIVLALAVLALQTEPAQDPVARFEAAQRLLQDGRADQALPELEALAGAYPENGALRFALGQAYLALDRHLEAERELRRAHALRPDYAPLLIALSQALAGQARLDPALALAYQAAARAPEPGPRLQLARLLLRAAQPCAAEALLRRLVLDRPELPGGRALLAQALIELGELTEAARVLERAIARGREVAPLRITLGLVRYALHQPTLAERALRAALEREPDRPLPRFYLGLALAESGELAAARAELTRVRQQLGAGGGIETLPRWLSLDGHTLPVAVAVALADLELRADELGAAMPLLEQALAAAPDHGGAHYMLAQALRRAGRVAEAEPHLEAYARLNQAREQLDLARQLARDAGDTAAAETALWQALELAPESDAITMELARLLALRSDPAARERLQPLIDHPAFGPEARALLAMLDQQS